MVRVRVRDTLTYSKREEGANKTKRKTWTRILKTSADKYR